MAKAIVNARNAAIVGGMFVFVITTVANIFLSPPLDVVDHLRNAFFAVLAAVFTYRVRSRRPRRESTDR